MAKLPSSSRSGIHAMLQGFSFYTMKGVEGVIMRRKGGPKRSGAASGGEIEELNRREFAIRARSVFFINSALRCHKELGDFNFAGSLNGLMRKVQVSDKVNDLGQRGVFLSKNKDILKGFSLNEKYLFDAAVRYPVTARINKAELSAQVHIPAIVPGINFHTQVKYPYFCFRLGLGGIPDVFMIGSENNTLNLGRQHFDNCVIDTNWQPLKEGSKAIDMELKLDSLPPDVDSTLILTVGFCFGQIQTQDRIVQVPKVGSAKVLELA